jgi:hypothetical protein
VLGSYSKTQQAIDTFVASSIDLARPQHHRSSFEQTILIRLCTPVIVENILFKKNSTLPLEANVEKELICI